MSIVDSKTNLAEPGSTCANPNTPGGVNLPGTSSAPSSTLLSNNNPAPTPHSAQQMMTRVPPRKNSSPFIKSPNKASNKPPGKEDISHCTVQELEERLARNISLLENTEITGKLRDGGSRLRAHNQQLQARLDDLKGIKEIRKGIANAHIHDNLPQQHIKQEATSLNAETTNADTNTNPNDNYIRYSDKNMSKPVTIKSEQDDSSSLQQSLSAPQTLSTSPTQQKYHPYPSRETNVRSRWHELRYHKLTTSSPVQTENSQIMEMPMEESLRLQTIEAQREKERKERVQARLDRLAKQGLSNAGNLALSDYMGNISDEEDWRDMVMNQQDEEDDGMDEELEENDQRVKHATANIREDVDESNISALLDTVQLHRQRAREDDDDDDDDLAESLGTFGQAFVKGYQT